MDGGSVLLETLAPPEAIISAIVYPEPFTEAEIAEHEARYPDEVIEEPSGYGAECEYVLDRRLLGAVQVVRRLAPLPRSGELSLVA